MKSPRTGKPTPVRTSQVKAVSGERGHPPETAVGVIDGYYANYTEYSKTLRTWLVAYGIGGPVLFLTSEAASKRLAASSAARCIITLFLTGVVLQIVGTLINKWAAWHVYSKMNDPVRAKGLWPRFWCWINNQTWIDLAVDLASIGAFGRATWMLLDVFLAAANAGG